MARKMRGATRLYREQPSDGVSVAAVAIKLLLLALLIGGGAWGGEQLLDPQQFPLRTVRIESPLAHVSQATIRETVQPHVEAGFLGVNVDAVRDDLEALPWIKSVTVRRAWPDKLVLHLTEQQPLAHWGKTALLNMSGEVFEPDQVGEMDNLPMLRGPSDTNRMVAEQYVAMQGMLKPLGLVITQMSLSERRALSLRLDNGLQLGLGRQDTDLRLLRFVHVYSQVIKPQLMAIESIDLRYTNGFAVHWREGFTPTAV